MSEEQTVNTNTKKCPFCQETISADAKKCKHCGEILDPALREIENLKRQQSQTVVVNNNNNNNNNSGIAVDVSPKSRVTYILLGLFFGGLGVHNFYAGRGGVGAAQLLITLFLGWLVFPVFIVWVWVIIELFAVTKSGNGVPFK